MDLTVPLIFISVLVVALFSLSLVFKFGIKKKSYEEALAEHRKHTSALLGTKPKLKEKKIKKAAKKLNKEKSTSDTNIETESPDESDTVESLNELEKTDKPKEKKTNSQKGKPSPKQSTTHVEFKEKAELPEIPVEKEIKEVINKKHVKKVRSILVNKPQNVETDLSTNLTLMGTNHFDVIHPKDELEMLHPISVEIQKTNSPKEVKKTEKPIGTKKNKHQKQEIEKTTGAQIPTSPESVEKPKAKEEKVISSPVSANQESVPNTGKEKKKKKSEFNSKQQLAAERDNLIHALRSAELSRSEVQLLIDLLLNKQLEAPAVIDEWTEGKSDPVQKLKKQLAEKEKLLADEQELLVGVQSKLKEVRSEQLAERAQMQQKLKAAEEGKIELAANNNRLQQKLQELEDARSKEAGQVQRLIGENKALQIQCDTVYQESDMILHNLKAENSSLTGDLQRLQQELQEQIGNYQACALQIQPLQEELRRAKEYIIDAERNNSFALASVENAHKEEQRLRDIIDQLKMENLRLQEERNMQVNGSADENKANEVKLLNLTNELTSVKSELSSATKHFHEAERQYQTELQISSDNYAKLKIEINEQQNKNNELRKKNWKVMEALNAAEFRNKATPVSNSSNSTFEIKVKEENAQKQFLQRLFPSLEDLKVVSAQAWQQEYERIITRYLKGLQNKSAVNTSSPDQIEEITRLKAEVLHYKSILDETDGALNKLQMNIEQEERMWRNKLVEKDAELQELRSQIIELQNTVTLLENKLELEKLNKQRSIEDQQVSKHTNKMFPIDSTSTIEKLSEELDRAKEQLRLEQTKNAVYQNGKSS